MKQVEVESAGLTDKGLSRLDNQDQFLIAELSSSMLVKGSSLAIDAKSRLMGSPVGYLYLIADGMGGHRAGKEASALSIEYFLTAILNSNIGQLSFDLESESDFEQNLRTMLKDAHQMIRTRSQFDSELEGMGTTLTLAYVCWPRMMVVHAGDTRCYVHRDETLRLITRDHTVANEMMKNGQLKQDSVERSPWANVLVNALGAGAPEVFADIYRLDMLEGDQLLLCSDGLNKHATDTQIQQCLNEAKSAEAACSELVRLANEGGGTDNVTIVVANFRMAKEPNWRLKTFSAGPSDEVPFLDFESPLEGGGDSTIDDERANDNSTDDSTESKDTLDYDENVSQTLDFEDQ